MILKRGQYKIQPLTKAVQKTQISAMSSGNTCSIKNNVSDPCFSHLPVTAPPSPSAGAGTQVPELKVPSVLDEVRG